jgi:hypothetical protein
MRITALPALFVLSIIAACIAPGCARVTMESTAAIYDPRTELKFDPRLLGVWLPDTVCVNLRRGEGNSYLAGTGVFSWMVIFGDAKNKAPTPDALHLVHIGNYDYFFAAPKPGESGTTFTGCCKVEFADERITVRGLNLQVVTDDLFNHPDALKHEWIEHTCKTETTTRPATQPAEPTTRVATTQPATRPTTEPALYNGNLKITDEPAAIRAYLIKHQDDANFFSDPIVLYRISK